MGMGTSISTAVSERTAVVIEDYMFDASTAGELKPEESPSDFHDTWDLDGTDFTPEVSPDDEGYWDDFENVVTNGNYEELGSELVTNGGFDTDSNWTFAGTNASISNGVGVFPDTTNNYIIQSNVVPASVKTYKLVYEIIESNGGGLGLAGGSSAFGGVNLTSSVGTHTKFVTSNGTQRNLQFNNQASFVGEIDNISLKQVDPNNRWNLGTGWTISDGKAHADVSSTAALSQTLSTGAGNTYEVTITVSNLTAGTLQPQFDGILATPTQINSNGTHTVKITAAGSSHGLLLYALNTSAFSIDNVSVKEYAITPLDV